MRKKCPSFSCCAGRWCVFVLCLLSFVAQIVRGENQVMAGEDSGRKASSERESGDVGKLFSPVPKEGVVAYTRATWKKLLSGGYNQQEVELLGIPESLLNRQNGWSRLGLRMREGVVLIELRRSTLKPDKPLENYLGAAIRVRGKIMNETDAATGRLKVAQFRIYNAEILVDEPVPEDLFELPQLTAAKLSKPDIEFDAYRRVRVSGQIVFVRGQDFFLMDGKEGLRFVPAKRENLAVGDLVDVVGFPEVSGAAPVLRGAFVRKTGNAALPEPKRLAAVDLTDSKLDATRVYVEAILASIRQTSNNLVMEMQAGSWRFLVRLNAAKETIPFLRLGSELGLTGVYCAQGGYKALGEDVAAVDLLMLSPADIKVLKTPSWWTFQRLLFLVILLVCLLAATALWNGLLHRRVALRSAELASEINERQRVEHKHAMEQERARIAQDLHDELGSTITEINMLATRAKAAAGSVEIAGGHLDQVSVRSRAMVFALDEIVWAMNPQHDTLESLVSYFRLYADRFLGLANITWHFESGGELAGYMANSRQRHQLFLVFKEALTNVVRHSGADVVRLSIGVEGGRLRILVADNGRGMPKDEHTMEMNGVANMRSRVEKLGGTFSIGSDAGRGTVLSVVIPGF